MKKFCLGVAMIASLICAPIAMAEPAQQQQGKFVTSKTAFSASAAKSQAGLTPTDVIVINASPYPIYFSVPNTNIDDLLLSGQANYIREYSRSFYVTVNIEDVNHTAFKSIFACPRAVIVVGSLTPAGVGVINEHC